MISQSRHMHVTLGVFSGGTNPGWDLTPEEESAFAARVHALSLRSVTFDPGATLWSLHYKGLIVDTGGSRDLPPHALIVGPYFVAPPQQGVGGADVFDLQAWLLRTTNSRASSALVARVNRALEYVDWERPPRNFPPFDPGLWAQPGYITWNNCYNYANDVMFRSEDTVRAFPGASARRCHAVTTCPAIAAAAHLDGVTRKPRNTPGEILMALAVDPSEPAFHWYRHHADGYWSHKDGSLPPVNHDDARPPKRIEDVELADRGPYTKFCGYFYSLPGDVKLAPEACCQMADASQIPQLLV